MLEGPEVNVSPGRRLCGGHDESSSHARLRAVVSSIMSSFFTLFKTVRMELGIMQRYNNKVIMAHRRVNGIERPPPRPIGAGSSGASLGTLMYHSRLARLGKFWKFDAKISDRALSTPYPHIHSCPSKFKASPAFHQACIHPCQPAPAELANDRLCTPQ